MYTLWQDLRYAARVLRKNPGASAIMILTLALGIGTSTAIFTVVYGVLLRPLPYLQPDRIMAIWEVNNQGHSSRLADPNFDDFRDQNRSFQSLAKYSTYEVSISGGSQPTRATVSPVTPEFMQVFGVQPFLGRDFSARDDHQGAAPTALVSYGYWSQFLGSTKDLEHAALKIEGSWYSVIGVMPPGFEFPQDVSVWVPADLQGENTSRTSHNYWGVGRLRDGVSVERARQDISAIARHIHQSSSEQNDFLLKDGTVIPLQESLTGKVRTPLLILLGAVAFLLLVACANVANLMLAQASARVRELAIRSALGAARGRLIRQFLTEALLLALAAGICGVLATFWGVAALMALAPQNLPGAASVAVNVPVLAFALALSVGVAVGLGVFTAMRATRGDVRAGLVEGGRAQAGTQGGQRVGRMIVSAQLAITIVLVVGAGLLGRSLMKVLQVDPGFRVDKIIGMDVSLPWPQDAKQKAAQLVFYSNLIERLGQLPGVRNVGAISNPPLEGGLPNGMFLLVAPNEVAKDFSALEAIAKQKERVGEADFGVATSGYFQMMGIPLVRGRIFDEQDGPNTPHVAVISESLARQQWPGQDPLGHTIEFGNMDGNLRLLTIVGVVGDVHDYGLDAPTQPTVYVDLFQRPHPVMTVTLLSDADTRSVTSAARSIVQELNPDVAPKFRTLSQVYTASLGSREFNLILLGFFGVTALLLATAGVFGVTAYTVSRRTRELGVRMALGAEPRQVLNMILAQSLWVAVAGLLAGAAGALALTRIMQSLLFAVDATDPATFLGVAALLVTVALAACYLPARRATKIDPIIALREE
jgi:putative ABC transport system permease protein